MSIITKPSSIVKGAEASITLNKVDLVSVVASMGTDAYYEDSSNWSKVILQYGSSTGNQKEIMSFDATQSSPTSTFLVSDKALDIFEVHKIIIVDFDGGVFSIPRSELVTAEFDIDTTPVASSGWDLLFGATATNGGGELHTTGFGWGEAAYQIAPLTGNFTVTGTFHSVLGGGTNLMIGFKKNLPVSAGGPSSNISSAIYVDGGLGSITGYNGSDGGSSTTSSYVSNATADFSFEISRVGSVITGSVNGSVMFTDTNYSAPVYLAAMIYSNNGYSILNYSVV